MADDAGAAEVLRVLTRYLVEIVEPYELCPWARAARERGEIAAGVLWGAPGLADWIAEASRLLALPDTRVAMVVAPELPATRGELAVIRDRVAAAIPSAGVAEFHPEAVLDLASPARLVPFVRRAPDPLLQLVPLAVIDQVRMRGAPASRAQQAAMLGGRGELPRAEIAARIAEANHATVMRTGGEIAARLADIADDRRAAYQRAGITACR